MTTLTKNMVGQLPATEDVPIAPYPSPMFSPTATDSETTIIERDADLYLRVTERLANRGATVPVEEVLGQLDERPLEEADRE